MRKVIAKIIPIVKLPVFSMIEMRCEIIFLLHIYKTGSAFVKEIFNPLK